MHADVLSFDLPNLGMLEPAPGRIYHDQSVAVATDGRCGVWIDCAVLCLFLLLAAGGFLLFVAHDVCMYVCMYVCMSVLFCCSFPSSIPALHCTALHVEVEVEVDVDDVDIDSVGE
jgi:hypothetical protein